MNRDGFQTGDPVTVRFFEAFAVLVEDGRTTTSGFCEEVGIDRPNFLKQRREPGRSILRPAWLSYLCRKYGVSPAWLLLGTGTMFRTKSNKNPGKSNGNGLESHKSGAESNTGKE